MKPPVIFRFILGLGVVVAGVLLFYHIFYGYAPGVTEHLLYVWPVLLVALLFLNMWVSRFHRKQEDLARALEASEESFQLMAENARDVIARFELVPKFTCAYINSAVKAITGYSPEEFYADPGLFTKLIHPEDKPLWDVLIKGDLELDKPQSLRWIGKDQRAIWIEQRMVRVNDEAGKLTAFEGIFRDITEAKEAVDKALSFSKEQYRSLFEEMSDAVFISTPEGRLLDVNPAAVALLGYPSKEELLRVNIAQDLFADPEQREAYKKALAESRRIKDYELTLKRRDGRKVVVLETTTAVADDHGNILAYRGIMREEGAKPGAG